MPAHDSEVREAEEEGIMMRWLSTVKHADGGTLTIEKMELDDQGFPQPTGEYEELGGKANDTYKNITNLILEAK